MQLKKKATPIKKKTLASFKKEVWRLVSLAVRLRDADNRGICTCISSGDKGYYIRDNMQAGHFICSKAYPKVRYNWLNINAQSERSNGFLQGDQYRYGINLNKKYGKNSCDSLWNIAEESFKITIPYLETVKQEAINIILENSKKKNLYDWQDMFSKKELASWEK